MGITVYSVVISVVFFNIALIAAFLMRRSNTFLAGHTVSFLLLMVLLGIIRLLTPIDFDRAYVVRSYQVIPAIEDLINRPIAESCTLGSLLLLFWLFGTVIFLVRDIVAQTRFIRASRSYPPVDRPDLIDLAGEFGSNFSILVSPSVSRPFMAGLFRPVIYLPDIELPEEQWKIILCHEAQHIRSHDGWKKLFFLLIQALFWWNPLAHISRAEIDTLIELQCDAKVTAGMRAEEVDAYLETLKSLANQTLKRSAPIGASALIWNQKQLVVRFEALQNAGCGKKHHPQAIAYLLLVSVFVLSYFILVQPVRMPDETDLIDGVPANVEFGPIDYSAISDGPYIRIENGEYHLFYGDADIGVLDESNLSIEPFNTFPILEDNS